MDKMTKLVLVGLLLLLLLAASVAAFPTQHGRSFHPAPVLPEGRIYTAAHGRGRGRGRGRQLRPTGIFAPDFSTSGVTIYPAAAAGGDGARLARLFKAGGTLLWFVGSLFH